MLNSAKNDRYHYSNGITLVDGLSGTYHMPLGHCSWSECDAIMLSTGQVHNSYKEDDGTATMLGNMLNGHLGQDRQWHIMTTGSEAVERAVMCAVPAGGTLVVMDGAFHGKSFFTSKAHYDTPWNWPVNVVVLPWMEFDELPASFDAVLFEPVQGWTGRAATDAQMHELRNRCHIAGATMIADEILCGLGRAGRRVYSADAQPDTLLLGKGMAGALPISAVGFAKGAKCTEPLVGWYATHAGYSLANRVAAMLLPKILLAASQYVPVMESRWQARFQNSRITGSLIYIYAGAHCKQAVQDLRTAGFIVADHSPYIRLAPCYTMDAATQHAFMDAIEAVL